MTFLMHLALVLLPLVLAAWATRALLRWVGTDGGPHTDHVTVPGEWSLDEPSVPYARR